MGISQLLPFLEPSTRNCHISEFRGRRVAVDAYCWLHRGARGCALKVAMGKETTAYVDYCIKYVNLFLQYDIKPIMVFDGRHLPAKATTESKRMETKKVARAQAMQLVSLGKHHDAYKFFCQCIDITPKMALALIKKLRSMKIDCIVAPYEADAQLAFFSINDIVDLVITEDSDLLLFGCKQVLYKLDTAGSGKLVDSDLLYVSMKMRRNQFTLDKFRYMCILSGCDYLDNLAGIGLKRALKFISLTVEKNPDVFLDRLPRYLQMFHLAITPQYKENFLIAEATFKHQTIFDTRYSSLAPLNPILPESQIHCVNAGEIFDNDAAIHIAWGNLDPLTMKRLDDWYPNEHNTPAQSIWRPGSMFTTRAPLVPNPSSLNQSQFSPRSSYREATDSSSSSSLPQSEDFLDDDDENLSELEPPPQEEPVPELDTSSLDEDVCPNQHLCEVLIVVDETPICTSDGAVPSTSTALESTASTVSMATQSSSSSSPEETPPERPQRKRKAETEDGPKKKKSRQLKISELFKKMDMG